MVATANKGCRMTLRSPRQTCCGLLSPRPRRCNGKAEKKHKNVYSWQLALALRIPGYIAMFGIIFPRGHPVRLFQARANLFRALFQDRGTPRICEPTRKGFLVKSENVVPDGF